MGEEADSRVKKKILLDTEDFNRLSLGNVKQIEIEPKTAKETYDLPEFPSQRMWGAGAGVMAMWMDDDYMPSSIVEDACEGAEDDEELIMLDAKWQNMHSELEAWKKIPEAMEFAYSPIQTGFPAMPLGEHIETEFEFEWNEESQKRIQEYEREIEQKEKELRDAVEKFCKLKEEE